jgi:hypothetical protein
VIVTLPNTLTIPRAKNRVNKSQAVGFTVTRVTDLPAA